MKAFSFTDINKTPGEVLDEALKGPVMLTKRGKERLVLMPADQFRRLAGRHNDPRVAGKTKEMPADLAADVLKAADAYLGDDDK